MNEEIARQNEYIYVLMQFAKPELIYTDNIYISEDDIVKKYNEAITKKYLQMVKF